MRLKGWNKLFVLNGLIGLIRLNGLIGPSFLCHSGTV